MWIYTRFGFFSVVKKPGDSDLTLRAYRAADINFLITEFNVKTGPIIQTPKNDYPFRVKIARAEFARIMALLALDLDYSNFKEEVMNRNEDDIDRFLTYLKVHNVTKRIS